MKKLGTTINEGRNTYEDLHNYLKSKDKSIIKNANILNGLVRVVKAKYEWRDSRTSKLIQIFANGVMLSFL